MKRKCPEQMKPIQLLLFNQNFDFWSILRVIKKTLTSTETQLSGTFIAFLVKKYIVYFSIKIFLIWPKTYNLPEY